MQGKPRCGKATCHGITAVVRPQRHCATVATPMCMMYSQSLDDTLCILGGVPGDWVS